MNILSSIQNSTPTEKLVYCLGLSPLWWLLGFNIFIYHFFAAYAYHDLLKKQGAPKVHPSLIFLSLYVVVYGVSLTFASFSSDSDFTRVIASFYNLTYWIMGLAILLVVFSDSENFPSDIVSKFSSYVLLFVFVVSSLVYMFLLNKGEVGVPSLLGIFMPLDSLPPLIGKSMTIQLLSQDWFSGEATPRLSIMSPYATAYGILIVILSFFVAVDRFRISLLLVGLFLVVSSLSRMALLFYLIFLFSICFSYLSTTSRRWLSLFFLFVSLILTVFLFGSIVEAWNSFNSFRQGSSDLRMLIYSMSWDVAMDQSPLIGLGIKPRDDYLVPLGSHSTFFGAVLKTGLIGVIFLCFFYISVVVRALKCIFFGSRIHALVGLGSLVLVVYSMFADVDAPQLVSFLFFFFIGMLFKERFHV